MEGQLPNLGIDMRVSAVHPRIDTLLQTVDPIIHVCKDRALDRLFGVDFEAAMNRGSARAIGHLLLYTKAALEVHVFCLKG